MPRSGGVLGAAAAFIADALLGDVRYSHLPSSGFVFPLGGFPTALRRRSLVTFATFGAPAGVFGVQIPAWPRYIGDQTKGRRGPESARSMRIWARTRPTLASICLIGACAAPNLARSMREAQLLIWVCPGG